ncbi:uncharacterized protein ACJ7VT_012264 [Polymixia lowei]
MTTGEQKSYDRRDRTLIFVDGDDQLDFEVEEFQSPRAAMSCGHAVTPMSLTKYCRWLLDKGDCTFVCPLRKDPNTDCDAKWPYTEVRKMALLTPEEMKYFELTVARNAARKHSEIKPCPGCKSSVVRKTPSDLSVHCTVCTANRRKKYLFCWQCLREWKGPAPRSDRCDNDGCSNAQLDLLRTCKEIIFEQVKGVSGCPAPMNVGKQAKSILVLVPVV